MDSIIQDIKLAVRLIAKRPGFAVVAIAAMALAIAVNTTIFSVVSAVMLRPLPYAESERLIEISDVNTEKGINYGTLSAPDFLDFRSQSQSFDDMAAVTGGYPQPLNVDGELERIGAAAVSANFFSVLGVRAALGRTFLPDEGRAGKSDVVMLSAGCWATRFGSSPQILGSSITLMGKPYTVVGVMPPEFINARPDDFLPIELWYAVEQRHEGLRHSPSLTCIGRLKPGVSIVQAQAEIDSLADGLEKQFPGSEPGWRISLQPLLERFVGDVRRAMTVLATAVLFVLLIACANVANLSLAQVSARQREFAVRAALGAGRFRLIQQILTESLLLSLTGGVLGIIMSVWLTRIAVVLAVRQVPRMDEVRIDGRVLAFALAASIISGVLFGLVPALQSSGRRLSAALKDGASSQVSGRKSLRTTLAVIEIAVSITLIVGAGLMVNSFVRLQRVNLGFKPDHLLFTEFLISPQRFPPEHAAPFCAEVVERASRLPGVQAAAATSKTAVVGGMTPGFMFLEEFEVEGRPVAPDQKRPDADFIQVTPGYFKVMGIPLLRGREFDRSDAAKTEPVIIINQAMAEGFWPSDDPLGKRVRFRRQSPWATIVGVIGDYRSESLISNPYPQAYSPHSQVLARAMSVVLRTGTEPMSLAPALKALLKEMVPEHPLVAIYSMDRWLYEAVARPRFNTILMLVFAGVAMMLASLGLYGVISFSVVQRTREIGLRMALGAERRNVIRMVLGQGMAMTLTGVVVGILASLALTRLMSGLLFGVTATDPITFAVCAGLVMVVSLIATYAPAAKASRVDPLIALRYE
jgi:putative ABC transport system permease protein